MFPDKDIPGWMEMLRREGFSDEEINYLLSRHNVEYSKASGINPVEIELEKLTKDLREKHGRTLTREQREYMRKSILSRPEFKDFGEKR